MRKSTIVRNVLLPLFLLLWTFTGWGQERTQLINQFPHNETFNSVEFPPAGWQNISLSSNDDKLWERHTSGSHPTVTPITGGAMATFRCYNFSNGTEAALISPQISVPADGYEIRFTMYRDNGYNTKTERVELFINNTPDTTGAELIGTVNRSMTQEPVVDAEGWYNYSYAVPEQTTDFYIILKGISEYGNNIHVDAITVGLPITQPILAASPESIDFGLAIPGETVSPVQVNLTNVGINVLQINQGDITITGTDAADFSLINDTWPIEIAAGEEASISLTFSPLSAGVKTADLQIVHNGENTPFTISLSGTGYLALTEFHEDFSTAVVPDLPAGWKKLIQSTSDSPDIVTTNYSSQNPVSPPNQVSMNNADDENAEVILISPNVTDFDTNWLTFYAYGTDKVIQVGTITDPTDPTTFELVESFTLTNAHQKFYVNIPEDTETPEKFIAFRNGNVSTYSRIWIDEITWEAAPVDPVFAISPEEKNFGEQQITTSSVAQEFEITNLGAGLLTINPSDITLAGTDASEFTLTTLDAQVALALNESATFSVAFSPATAGEKSAEIVINDNVAGSTPHTIALTGTAFDATLNPPFAEDFIGTFPPQGWSRFKGELTATSTLTSGSAWSHDKFANIGDTNNAARVNLYNLKQEWLITPVVNMDHGIESEEPVELVFDLALTPWGGVSQAQFSANDYFAVVVSYDNGTTWSTDNIIFELTPDHTFNNEYPTYTVNVDNMSGNVLFGFYARRTEGSSPDLEFSLTNVGVRPAPPVYPVTITVNHGTDPIENATVTIEGVQEVHQTDANGQLTLDLPAGVYPYTVEAQGMIPVTGQQFEVIDAPLAVNVTMDFMIFYDVTFNVVNQNQEAVPNIEIELQGYDNIITDATGQATTSLINGEYFYSIHVFGFDSITDASFTVSDADLTVDVAMNQHASYTITFTVTDDQDLAQYLQDVTIEFPEIDRTIVTNASGVAVIDLPGGTYAYNITKHGYFSQPDQSITLVDQDLAVPVIMVERPIGSLCENPIVLTLPVVDYANNTEIYGNDYSGSDFNPITSSMNGNDMVFEFTIDELSFLSGTISGGESHRLGMHITSACPGQDAPADILIKGEGYLGGSFENFVIEPGTYLMFVSTNSDHAAFTMSLSAVAVPAEPVLVVTPDEKDFGQVAVFSSASQNFTISNMGGGTIYLSPANFAITGVDTEDFFISPIEEESFNLQTGESATVKVNFLPLSEGAKSANLTIGPVKTNIALSGEGLDTSLPVPFSESFTESFPPEGWDRTRAVLEENPSFSGSGSWTHHTFGNTGSGNNSAHLNIWGEKKEWLITPVIDLGEPQGESAILSFDMALTPWTGTSQTDLGDDDYIAVLISPDGGMTWSPTNVLIDWDSSSTISNTGENHQIELTGYSGKVRFAFYVRRPSGNDPDLRLYFTNVNVDYPTPPAYSATFVVKNQDDQPIDDAAITLNGMTYNPGEYFFEELTAGTYDYQVSHTGYVTQSGTIEIIDQDITETVILEQEVYSATFIVEDSEQNPINDAVITFDGQEYAAGTYIFSDLIAGTYDYQVEKEGYYPVTGSVEIIDEDVTQAVVLALIPEPVYTVTFIVEDEQAEAIEDAVITFNDVTLEAGEYVITEVNAGTYNYSVTREGYEEVNDQLTVVDQDITVTVVMTSIPEPTYMVTFNVHMHAVDFDPENDIVYIAGIMTDWVAPGDNHENQVMTQSDEDPYIFTRTYELPAGSYEYKYAINAGWDGAEWDGGDNRVVVVSDEDIVVDNVFGDPDDSSLGIEPAELVKVNLYPNPASTVLNITSDMQINEIKVIDMLGQVVNTVDAGSNRHVLNIGHLNNGIYLIQVHTNKGVTTQRVQIRK